MDIVDFGNLWDYLPWLIATLGTGWGALKFKVWFTPKAPDGFEVGVMVGSPYGRVQIIAREGEKVRVRLFNGRDFITSIDVLEHLPQETVEATKEATTKRREAQKQAVEGMRQAHQKIAQLEALQTRQKKTAKTKRRRKKRIAKHSKRQNR